MTFTKISYFITSLFVIALAIFISLVIGFLYVGYNSTKEVASTTGVNLVGAIAADIRDVLNRAEGDLRTFVGLVPEEDFASGLTGMHRNQVEAVLEQHLSGFRQLTNYRIFNSNGDIIASSGPGKTFFNVYFNIVGIL